MNTPPEERIRALLRHVPDPPDPDSWAAASRSLSDRRRTRARVTAAASTVLAVGVCVGLLTPGLLNPHPSIVATPARTQGGATTADTHSGLLAAESLLVEQADGDVTLCTKGVYQTAPPSCSGVTIKGPFPWGSVKHREVHGIRFTEVPYRLVGSLAPPSAEGVFTLAGPPESVPTHSPIAPRRTADLCTDPMRDAEPSMAGPRNLDALMTARKTLPVVSLWLSDDTAGVNVLVSGDSRAAFDELRKVWGGPLCVASSTKATESERQAAMARVAASLPEDQYLSASIDSGDLADPTLEVHVLTLVPDVKTQIERTAGPRVKVTIQAMFTPYEP